MTRRQSVVRLPAATPILALLAWDAYLTWETARRGDWIGAIFVSVAAALMAYLLFRALRKPKGTRMALLSKNEIFAADDRTYTVVAVPEWGAAGEVRLRSLTGSERDAYEASMLKRVGGKQVEDLRNVRAKLVALSAVDENGQRIFEQNDIVALSNRNSAALGRLFDAACKLSGINDADVKELEEGFGEGPNGPSTSASPSPSGHALSLNSLQGSAPAN